jgi:hypothetical protein
MSASMSNGTIGHIRAHNALRDLRQQLYTVIEENMFRVRKPKEPFPTYLKRTGTRVEVRFIINHTNGTKSRVFYPGVLTIADTDDAVNSKPHYVEFDDGEKGWFNLTRKTWKLECLK